MYTWRRISEQYGTIRSNYVFFFCMVLSHIVICPTCRLPGCDALCHATHPGMAGALCIILDHFGRFHLRQDHELGRWKGARFSTPLNGAPRNTYESAEMLYM